MFRVPGRRFPLSFIPCNASNSTPMSSSPVISLITSECTIKVSSTLDKSVGKKNLIDNNPETCWTSQSGLPQSIQITFPSPVIPHTLHATFQGGFVGTRCCVQTLLEQDGERVWKTLTYIYPGDVNKKQTFTHISPDPPLDATGIKTLKLVFEESSDFFGRITLYDLILEGIQVW